MKASVSSNRFNVILPIDSDKVFLSFVDSSASTNYFYKADFSNSGTSDWKKQISCPSGTGCNFNNGEAVLSKDGNRIYAFTYFALNFQFYTLDAGSGEIASSTFKLYDTSGSGNVGSIGETNGKIVLYFKLSQKRVLVFNITTSEFDYSFESSGTTYSIKDMAVTNSDFIFAVGKTMSTADFFISKNHYSSLAVISDFSSSSTTMVSTVDFDPINSANSELTFLSKAGTYTTTNYLTAYILASSPTFTNDISVWNFDHFENDLASGATAELEFFWT